MTDTTKRFDNLTIGDVIYWRGAENDRAVVVWVGSVDQSVQVRWNVTEEAQKRNHLPRVAQTTLRWRPSDPVTLWEEESESVDDMIAYAKAHGIRVGRLSVIELGRRIAEHRRGELFREGRDSPYYRQWDKSREEDGS
jgi:hypothetical protein